MNGRKWKSCGWLLFEGKPKMVERQADGEWRSHVEEIGMRVDQGWIVLIPPVSAGASVCVFVQVSCPDGIHEYQTRFVCLGMREL